MLLQHAELKLGKKKVSFPAARAYTLHYAICIEAILIYNQEIHAV